MINHIRNYLQNNHFLEVQTPLLTAPVEEGSRGFVVSSRYHKDMFYSLPQSPQIYKQFLTYGGINYFQIAPVFRDEDGRLDRINGEFYQLDLEMITEDLNEIIAVSKGIVTSLLRAYNVSYHDKGEVSYEYSMKNFNNDKPHGEELPTLESFQGQTKTFLNLIIVKDFPMFRVKDAGITYMNNPFAKVE